jgi:hypothetical protein
MILPYLFGEFHPSQIQEYAADFYLRSRNLPRTVGVSAPSSAAKAGVAASPASPPTLSGVISRVFLHLHSENIYRLQVSRMAPLTAPRFFLPCMTHLTLTPGPDVIIKLKISNAFNTLYRQLTPDVLGGKASCDYACGLKEGDNIETVCGELRVNMFKHFRAILTTQVPPAVLGLLRQRSRRLGDPLEMTVFCLSVHHLWGWTLSKHHQDAYVRR